MTSINNLFLIFMDVEFHYYLTYIIARFAKLSHEFAYKVAYSSQYVDDNLYEQRIFCPITLSEYRNRTSATYSPFVTEDTARILIGHHFLPGDKPDPLLVTEDSETSVDLMRFAISTCDPYMIGIAIHAYADTWAHQNFKGINHSHNDSRTIGGAFLPSIGHTDFGNAPDLIGIYWYDPRNKQTINNNKRFIRAGLRIFDHLICLNQDKHDDPVSIEKTRQNLAHTLAMLMRKISRYSFIEHEIKRRKRIKGYLRYHTPRHHC